MNNKKYLLFILSVFSFVLVSVLTQSCADDPSSLGLKFIPGSETTGVRIFDSYVDTMSITQLNTLKRANTFLSAYMMVGNSGTYNSEAVLRFDNLWTDYDSAVVNSATLTLYYANYYYPYTAPDSLGQTSLDIYKVTDTLDLQTATVDSLHTGIFGTVSQGSYTGFMTSDSQEVQINLNTSMVKDWLEAAADPNYANRNYGIALLPNASSTSIKGFSGTQTSVTGLKPKLTIIVTKGTKTDTVSTVDAHSTSFIQGTLPQITGEFTVQAGISFIETMRFDMSHVPNTATINDAMLYLTIDPVNTHLQYKSPAAVDVAYISDTAGVVTSGYSYLSYSDGDRYIVRMIDTRQACPFQRWLNGETNYGVQIAAKNSFNTLDQYVFYGMDSPDPTKRPRLVIKYTPRVTP